MKAITPSRPARSTSICRRSELNRVWTSALDNLLRGAISEAESRGMLPASKTSATKQYFTRRRILYRLSAGKREGGPEARRRRCHLCRLDGFVLELMLGYAVNFTRLLLFVWLACSFWIRCSFRGSVALSQFPEGTGDQ